MTNNQLIKEWLQQTIAELESVRDEIPFGIDTNSELELAAFKLALAAMDNETVGNEFIPKNLDKALGVVGMALPESKEEFNFQIERWIQRLIDRVIRYADEFKEQPAPVAPECHSMFDVVTSILDGIDRTELDDGWWETSAGAEFGREKLEEIRACMIKKPTEKSAFLQYAERLATDAKELAERVQRNDVKALTTSEEHRQLRELVMMVKMLCRTVRKYNPESQQAANFIAYLQKEGLISAADCLRDSDPLDNESEDHRG